MQDKAAKTPYFSAMTRARPYDRDKALKGALDLFWLKGYHATSLKDLEAALEMKPGSIYAAFKSKEALYLAALERYFEEGRAALRALTAAAPSPLTALKTHLRAYVGPGEDVTTLRACMLIKSLLETKTVEPAIAETTAAYLDAIKSDLAEVFRAAQRAGEIAPDADADLLAHRHQANAMALRIEAHRGVGEERLDALAESMVQDLEALRPQAAEPRA